MFYIEIMEVIYLKHR